MDELELWECAVLLGELHPDDGEPGTGPAAASSSGTPSRNPFEYPDPESEALIRARIAYAEGRGPKPEVKATDPRQVDALGMAVASRR